MAERPLKIAIRFAKNRMAGVSDRGNSDGKGELMNSRAPKAENDTPRYQT